MGVLRPPDESTDLVAENWEQLTEDPNFVSIPDRITTDANTGSASMKVAASSSGSALVLTVSQIVGLAGGPEVIPGETYDFSFFAKDVNNGPGFVKEYLIRWLNENDDEVAFEPFTGFSNGSGNWYEVTATGLVAPANASDVQILFFGKTGAFAGSEGEFLIDDVSFSTQGGGGGGTVLSATSEEGYGLSWDTVDGQLYGVENSTDLNGFTDTGIEVTGDGNPVSVAVNSTEPKLFFRLFCE